MIHVFSASTTGIKLFSCRNNSHRVISIIFSGIFRFCWTLICSEFHSIQSAISNLCFFYRDMHSSTDSTKMFRVIFMLFLSWFVHERVPATGRPTVTGTTTSLSGTNEVCNSLPRTPLAKFAASLARPGNSSSLSMWADGVENLFSPSASKYVSTPYAYLELWTVDGLLLCCVVHV